MMIPKKIHYVWCGPNALPELHKRCIESWRNVLVDYEFFLWNEDNLPYPSAYFERCMKEEKYGFASDYIRSTMLYEEGGVYLDSDTEMLKSLDDLLKYPCFVGLEKDNRTSPAVWGAEERHWLPKAFKEALVAKKGYSVSPRILTPLLNDGSGIKAGYLESKQTMVLPPKAFFPYNPYDEKQPVKQLMAQDITDETYAIHHWAHSWRITWWDTVKTRLPWRKALTS